MPRVAPIVRSKRYEHAIATLVAKRSEIAGQIKFKCADLAGQLVHIDAVLALLGYKGDPSQIVPLQRKRWQVDPGTASEVLGLDQLQGRVNRQVFCLWSS